MLKWLECRATCTVAPQAWVEDEEEGEGPFFLQGGGGSNPDTRGRGGSSSSSSGLHHAHGGQGRVLARAFAQPFKVLTVV